MAFLKLISLPIGNYSDISQRALQTLTDETYFLSEDTRVFKSYLKHYGIEYTDKYIDSYHDHTNDTKLEQILDKMARGIDFCLVSDAGSPVISDPAFPLIEKILEHGHQLQSIPGTSSVVLALELSGLAPIPFAFYGFLPRTKEKKISTFKALQAMSGTHIFFESPKRLESTLLILMQNFAENEICVARELTKKFETITRFKAADFIKWQDQIEYRGECVLLVNVKKCHQSHLLDENKLQSLTQEYLSGKKKGNPRQLSKLLAEITGESSKSIYQKLL